MIENKNVVTKKYTENIKNNGKNAVLSLASLSQRYNISRKKKPIQENSLIQNQTKTTVHEKFSRTNISILKEDLQ